MKKHYSILLAATALFLAFCSSEASANYINGTTVPPATAPTPDEACLPMGSQLWERWSYCDVASALFAFSQVDMALAGPMPIVLRRVYRSEAVDTTGNAVQEPFGNGMTFDYNMFLWSESEANGQGLTNVDLILPDGARVFCNCNGSSCVPPSNSFTCKATPSQTFYGATITYTSSPSWVLKTKDGTSYTFNYCGPNCQQASGSILQSITDRYNNQVTINRQMPNLWQIKSSNGRYINLTLSTINGAHVITQARDSAGRATSYGYTTYGPGATQTSMTSSTDANGKTTNYTWYTPVDMGSLGPSQNNGMFVEETDVGYIPSGCSSGCQFGFLTPPGSQGFYSLTYTMSGGKVSAADLSDPMNYPRHLVFNSSGYLTSEALNYGGGGGTPSETTTYNRDPGGSNFVTDKIDALNRDTHYSYDLGTGKVGDLLSVTRLSGTSTPITTSFTYTSTFHQLESITDPLNHTTNFYPCSPDTNGFVCQFKDAVGNTITFTPEPTGQVMTATDAAGDQTTFGYDPAGTGDLTSVTDPNKNKTTATYDGAGRLQSITDPLRNTTSYQLDGLGNVTQITDARNGVTKFGYDDVGNLLSITDANTNPLVTNKFDLRNRLTSSCDALSNCAKFTLYDADDNLKTSSSAAQVTQQYIYDNLNRRIENDYDVGGTSPSNVQLTYDLGDRLIQAVDSANANATVTRQFGQLGSQTGQNTTKASGLDFITEEATPSGTVDYVPDLAGRRSSMQLTVGAKLPLVNYTYDAADKLLTVGPTGSITTKSYTGDPAGRLHTVTLPNSLIVTYGYDQDSHVTSLTYGTAGNLMYSYDANGRRTGVSGSLASTGIPGALGPIAYNKDNSLASIGGFSVDNYPVGAIKQLNGGCPACNGTFTYDPRGHLFESSTIANGTTITQDNYYDALGRRYQTAFMAGSGNTITSYVFDGQNAVQSFSSSFSNSWLLGLDLDELYFENVDGTQSSVLKDALGSVVGLTNSSKTLTDTYSYEPYGATTHTSGSSFNGQLFAGQTDDFTNLYFMRNRYYMPALGRFISRDPIGLSGGINIYAYAGDDPINSADPTDWTS